MKSCALKSSSLKLTINSIVWSRWEPNALHDPKKTFRIYERCDDEFVVDDGKWKLKYSLVTNLAPKVENPYFNDGKNA